MVLNMKGYGRKIRPAEREGWLMQMGTFMRELGKMIKPMDMECSSTPITLFMRVNGLTTCNTDMELKPGKEVLLSTQVYSIKARKMEREGSNGRTEASTKGTLLTANFKVLEDTSSLILTNGTKESSEWAIWKAEVLKLGVTERSTKETSKMEKKTEKEPLSGPMLINTLVAGKMAYSTGLESGLTKMAPSSKEFGKTERERSGLQVLSSLVCLLRPLPPRKIENE
jgi:hypothetical protein